MKILSRNFTLKEKMLLTVLSVLLLGLLYFYAVDQPVKHQLADAASKQESLETELIGINSRLTRLKAMSEELDSVIKTPAMPSYNASKEEVALLNDIMQEADSYSMNFFDVTREGNQIRREVAVTFTAGSYDRAVEMIRKLSESKYRCLLSNVQCAADGRGAADLTTTPVSVTLTLTFYETMVGGTPDAGLPVEAEAEDI